MLCDSFVGRTGATAVVHPQLCGLTDSHLQASVVHCSCAVKGGASVPVPTMRHVAEAAVKLCKLAVVHRLGCLHVP